MEDWTVLQRPYTIVQQDRELSKLLDRMTWKKFEFAIMPGDLHHFIKRREHPPPAWGV